MLARTSNPTMGVFNDPQKISSIAPTDGILGGVGGGVGGDAAGARPTTMTVQGTVNASGILITLCAAGAVGGWGVAAANPGLVFPLWIGGGILAFVLSLVIIFAKKSAPFVAPVFAIVEGGALAALSYFVADMLSAKAPGLGVSTVFQALLITFSVFAAMLIAYTTRLIRPGKIFTACVITGAAGLGLFYLVAFVGSMFFQSDTLRGMISIQNASPLGIGISVLGTVLASLFLVLDFKAIEEGAQHKLPKYMEWYAGFALLTTLAWLYVEVLRLLAKLRSSD